MLSYATQLQNNGDTVEAFSYLVWSSIVFIGRVKIMHPFTPFLLYQV